MCGITGFFNPESNFDPRPFLKIATDSLAHRGPDASGTWAKTDLAGLGHRRLSIIDLSESANQPMISGNGRFVIAFNGEIYNFSDVRKQLEDCGTIFKSHSDTEVVIEAFASWGTECVSRFIGMFAFAIFDLRTCSLFLCRDRAGVKPLHYFWDGHFFAFASEIRALREYPPFRKNLNHQAVAEFFQYGYISQPDSIYANVKKLPPGSWLQINLETKTPAITSYWDIRSFLTSSPVQPNPEELENRLEQLLCEAFSYRMVADVEVGVFLSGGLDSSLVTALLTRSAGKKVRTFTLGFNEAEIDESPWAARIASHLGTSHTEFRLSSSEAEKLIKELPDVYDEPFGDNSAVSTLMLSRLVSKEVKVVLSADGGDELFGGYDYYRKLPSDFSFFTSFPEAAKQFLAGAGKIISRPGLQININSLASSRLKKLFRNAAQIVQSCRSSSSGNFYRFMRAIWQPYEIKNLLGDYHEKRFLLDDLTDNLSLVEKMMAWDLFYYIPDDILTKVDRATMSTGLEGRDPFLDHRVIEMALQLPESMKIRNTESKSVLRRLLSRHMPSELFERPKRGFPIPLVQWRTSETGREIAAEIDAFIAEGACGLNTKTVRSELEFYRRSSGNEFQIWLLYVFASWARRWLG